MIYIVQCVLVLILLALMEGVTLYHHLRLNLLWLLLHLVFQYVGFFVLYSFQVY